MSTAGPVTLNADLGELADEPEELYQLVTQANVACGGHAGDDASMRRGIRSALASGARIAAHPSYPDRAGFGRTSLAIDPRALYDSVRAQCASLAAAARSCGAPPIGVIKAHGALYHDAASDPRIAQIIYDAARAGLGPDALVYVGPPTEVAMAWARGHGVDFCREGFADRLYLDETTLAPRSTPGAIIDDPVRCAAQALALARGGRVETVCIHGDTAHALEVARAVRGALAGASLLRTARAGSSFVGRR